jgi:hypothetical protein
LLAATAVLVPLQNRHLVLALWTQTRQRPGRGILASVAALACAASLPWLLPAWGLWSVPLVMIGAEALWVTTVGLRRHDRESSEPLQRVGKSTLWPVAALGAAFLASLMLDLFEPLSPWLRLLCPLLAAAVTVGAVAWTWPAWSSGEQSVLSRCLPPWWGHRWLRSSRGTSA